METVNFATPENSAFYTSKPYKQLDSSKDEFRLLELLQGTGADPIQCNLIEPPGSADQSYECISYQAQSPKAIRSISVNGRQFNAFETLGAALQAMRLPDRSRILW